MDREIASMFREDRVFHPPDRLSKRVHIRSRTDVEELYQESPDRPEAF